MLHHLPSFPLHTLMATTPTKLSLFFFLFFLQLLHARESQFFSKLISPKENELLPITIQPQQQDQDFIPQTKDSTGYGRLPPSTTTTNGGSDDILPENYKTVAYTTPIHSKDTFVTTAPQYANKNQYNQKQDKFYDQLPPLTTTNGGALPENYNTVSYTTPIHSRDSYETTAPQYGNKDQYHPDSSMYNSRKQGMSETRFMDGGDIDADGWNTYNNKQGMSDSRVLDNGKYHHVSDMYNSATNDDNMYNTQKQGMRTRYLEDGKYFYDLKSQSSNPRP